MAVQERPWAMYLHFASQIHASHKVLLLGRLCGHFQEVHACGFLRSSHASGRVPYCRFSEDPAGDPAKESCTTVPLTGMSFFASR